MTHFQISKMFGEEYSKAVFYAHCFFVLLSLFLFISFFFLFFFFINDLLPQIKIAQLNMYAEDGQLHTSNSDLVSLEGRISLVVNSANAWYENNPIIAKDLGLGIEKRVCSHGFEF